MDDYISREAAYTLAKKICDAFRAGEYSPVEMPYKILDWIDDIPAANVRENKRGKWIKYAPHNSDMMTCSECEKYWILDGDQYDFHFCPNCGADMREEQT